MIAVPPVEHNTFTHALQAVYTMAQEKLPADQQDALAKAVEIARLGRVVMTGASSANVLGSDGSTWYETNGSCSCPATQFHPDEVCKHRLALRLTMRARELVQAEQQAPPAPADCWQPMDDDGTPCYMTGAPCPHGQAVSSPPRPPVPHRTPLEQHIQTLLDKGYTRDELDVITPKTGQPYPVVKFVGLLRMVHEKYGIARLEATFTHLEAELAVASAVLVLKDGRTFHECGDATPDNVGPKVKPHYRRMALTRAKARACRDVLTEVAPTEEELAE